MTAPNMHPILARDVLPDVLLRLGIRRICAGRLREQQRLERQGQGHAFVDSLAQAPLALATQDANAQHYEVPARFYELVLGPHLKYSCSLFGPGVMSLAAAEDAMLRLTMERAGLRDGQDVLELGCGWGSLTLAMARAFPSSRITAVSNSASQKAFIDARAQARGLGNVTVVTADMNSFDTPQRFDRVVSVEMFEHMRNWPLLLQRISTWMKPEARLFVHIFVHRCHAYPYEDRDATDWMARHFFTGGMMPSLDLLNSLNAHLAVEQRWTVEGTHYERTSNAWLANLDANHDAVLELFARTYGASSSRAWLSAWRLFFMACAELFGYAGGTEWHVAHYLLRRA